MKSKYLILVFGVLFFFACNQDEDHFDEMPQSDNVALEGMGEAFEAATHYNDSLTICLDDFANCDSTTMWHYDNMFHQFDEMFNQHHNDYSHNNVDDDHHHDTEQTVWHGNMMGHGGDSHNDEPHGYEHNNESFEEMMHLRELHDDIHPE